MKTHKITIENVETVGARDLQFSWSCTCTAYGPFKGSRSDAVILGNLHLLAVQVPDVQYPEHRFIPDLDEVSGATLWTCPCGEKSRAGGHLTPSRAMQAHYRHVQRALLEWTTTTLKRENDFQLKQARFQANQARLEAGDALRAARGSELDDLRLL